MSRVERKYGPGSRSGLTLIEVVASLALMGTLLVSAMLGASAHLRQVRTTRAKLTAIEGIDRLFNNWVLYDFADNKLKESALVARVNLLGSDETVGPSKDADYAIRVSLPPQARTSVYEIEVVRVEAVSRGGSSPGQVLTWLEIVRPKREITPVAPPGALP